jgi:hypothetical protein
MKFDTVDTIMRLIIILLLLVVLITNIIEIANFANSRVKLSTLSSKDVNPSYDSLNLKYCDYYPMSEKNVINFENFKLLSIYIILFIIFWYNRIINIFSNTSLPNEIKILFYNKYYNYDIYKNCNNEYYLIYGFMIYILLSLLIRSYIIYSEYNGENVDDIKIHDNIKIIDTLIIENVDCNLLNKYDHKKFSIDETELKNYITTELKNNTSDNYLKICITLILTDKINNKKTIVDIKNLCNNSKCIYSRLERNIDNIFPEDIEKYISKIKSALPDDKKTGFESSLDEIKTKYSAIRKKLIDSYNIIKEYKSSYLIYYKFGLLTSVLGGILFSSIALAYFMFIDFKIFNKFINDNIYYSLDYYMNTYKNAIYMYIAAFICIYGAFIINF